MYVGQMTSFTVCDQVFFSTANNCPVGVEIYPTCMLAIQFRFVTHHKKNQNNINEHTYFTRASKNNVT